MLVIPAAGAWPAQWWSRGGRAGAVSSGCREHAACDTSALCPGLIQVGNSALMFSLLYFITTVLPGKWLLNNMASYPVLFVLC